MALKKGIGMRMQSSGVVAKLDRSGEKVEKHSIDVMRRYGDKVLHLAKLNVPVKNFYVEDAIVKEERRSGLNRRIEITVGVDASKLLEMTGKSYDYSIWLHEGSYNLGPLSEVKNEISKAEDPRAKVGNKFLERAITSVKSEALRELRKGIKGAIR